MENQTPNPIEQKIILRFEEVIADAHASKHLQSLQKQLKQLDKVTKRFEKTAKNATKGLDRFNSSAKKTASTYGKLITQQKQLNGSMSVTSRGIRKNTREITRHRRETLRAVKANNSFSRSLSKIAGLVGAAGLGYMAVSRIRRIMDSRLNLAVTGGADQIRLIKQLTGGRNVTSAIELAAKFQQQSPYSRFSLGGRSLKGLVNIQRQMEPIGLDLANDLILQVTKSLEPAKLKQMLKTAAGGNVHQALLQSASGGNVGAITSAINALEIGTLAGENKLDPMLQAATEFKQTGNRLADAFDKLSDTVVKDLLPTIQALTGVIEKFAGKIGGLSTGQLLVGAGGALLGYKGIKSLGKAALRRGLAPGIPGVSPLGGGRGGRMPSIRPALPHLGPNGYPVISPLHLPAGGIVGTGLAGGAAAASTYTAVKSGQTAYSERQALKAIEETQQNDRLFKISRELKLNATTELARLKAKRLQLDAMISSTAPSGNMGIKKGWVGKTLGFYGNFLQADTKQIDRLRKQRKQLHEQIQVLEKQENKTGSTIFAKIFDKIQVGVTKTQIAAEKLKTGLDTLIEKGLEQNLKRLQQQAARTEQLQLTASEKSSVFQLRRLEFQLAQTTPLGTIGAMSELNSLQKQIRDEIGALNQVLQNIDQSTKAGTIEANKVRGEILQLRIEERENTRKLQQATLDSAVAQVMNAGKAFSKIIIDQDRNLELALRKRIIKEIPHFTGSKNPKGLRPLHINDVLGIEQIQTQNQNRSSGKVTKAKTANIAESLIAQQKEALKNSEERVKIDKRLLEMMCETPEPEMMEFRPTRSGGRTALGPPGT